MRKFLLLAFIISYSILFFNPGLGKLYDSPRYISLGYSLAIGNGYKFIFDSENSPCFYNNYIFPYFLSHLVKLSGLNFYILKGFVLILSFLCLVCFYNLTKLDFKDYEALYISILFLASPIFIEFSDKVLTEMPFLLFLLISFYFLRLWEKNGNTIYLFLLMLSIYLTIFTRIIGIAVLFSLMLRALLKKEKKIIFASLILLIPVALTFFLIQARLTSEDRFYHFRYFLAKNPFVPDLGLMSLPDLLQRIPSNLVFYFLGIGREIINFPLKPIWLSLIILGIIISGIYKAKLKNLYLIFFIIYLFFYLIWPWQDIRFIMPITFLILWLFYIGLNSLISVFHPYAKKITYGLILLLSVYGGMHKVLTKITIENVYSAELREFIQLAQWSKDNLNNEAVILSSNPALVYLLSFKKGVFLIYTNELDKITSYLKRKKVTHILADRYNSETIRYFYPWLNKNRDRLKVSKINGGSVLFQLD